MLENPLEWDSKKMFISLTLKHAHNLNLKNDSNNLKENHTTILNIKISKYPIKLPPNSSFTMESKSYSSKETIRSLNTKNS